MTNWKEWWKNLSGKSSGTISASTLRDRTKPSKTSGKPVSWLLYESMIFWIQCGVLTTQLWQQIIRDFWIQLLIIGNYNTNSADIDKHCTYKLVIAFWNIRAPPLSVTTYAYELSKASMPSSAIFNTASGFQQPCRRRNFSFGKCFCKEKYRHSKYELIQPYWIYFFSLSLLFVSYQSFF